jgi:TolB protein
MRKAVLLMAIVFVSVLAWPLHGQVTLPEPGDARSIFADRDTIWSLSWSPDGRQIAFARRPWVSPTPLSDIWVIAADGSAPRRLTGEVRGEQNWYPSWSPDGRQIAFYRWKGGKSEIWVMNADGTGARALTNLGEDARYPSWSPDGTRIVFAVQRNRNWDLAVANADGSAVAFLTEGAEREEYPRFLSDPTKVLYSRAHQLRILDLTHRESRVVTLGPNDTAPSVSADGRYIAYSSRKTGDFSHLWLIRTEDALEGMVPDSRARQLTRGTEIWDTTPAFAPDGTKVVFARQTRTGGVWGPAAMWVLSLR